MKKIFLFFVIATIAFAENFGANIFPENSYFYFYSKTENIFNILDKNFENEIDILKKNKNFKNIDIEKVIENKEYSVVFLNDGEKLKFIILVNMIGLDKKLIESNEFETETFNGMTIKYSLGDKPYIYGYDDNYLIFSDDMNLFFWMIDTKNEKFLKDKKSFKKLMNYEEKDTKYKYYIEKDEIIEDKVSVAKSKFLLENGEINRYYIPGEKTNILKEYNLENIIPPQFESIEMGRNTKYMQNEIEKQLSEFYVENELFDFDLNMAGKIKYLNGTYFFFKKDNYLNSEQIIKKIYEKILFFNKKIEFIDLKKYKMYEIPLLYKKIYLININDFVVVTTENKVLQDFLNGFIKNTNFNSVENYDNIKLENGKIFLNSLNDEVYTIGETDY
ncbi:hypothetical protein EV215_1133 [Hypnocyclicus thermotrophus]|uniref:Uncharacterized protein n=1 Tax=Hypnocyclicus thermotrophus TaxID=1627895 RepID=A0AA46I5R8_9FUSO|nr:hypothetical protein [Hypnocyclicus thermotrophus]TDT70583.1 hypothetical protein EV215_1133 [Hypnocyclicus thermotrophus]